MADTIKDALVAVAAQEGRVADETWLAIVVYLIEKAIESLPEKGDEG